MEAAIPQRSTHTRRMIAIVLAAVALAYTIAVIRGAIPQDRRIDAVHLGVLALAAAAVTVLASPGLFGRLRAFEVKGVKIELLEHVREKQLEQEEQLRDIRLIIPLLLPEEERRHLQNLARRRTTAYKGSEALRSELRRLRTIGLVRMLSDKHWISHIEDGHEVNLAEYMDLTELGKRWVKRLNELDERSH